MILIAKSIHQEERNTISWQSNWWFQPMLVKFDYFPRVKIKKWNHHLAIQSWIASSPKPGWRIFKLGLKRHPGILRLFDNLPFSFSCLEKPHKDRADMLQKTAFFAGIHRAGSQTWMCFELMCFFVWKRMTGCQENMCNSITTSRRVLDDGLIRIPFTAQYSILIPKSLKQILLVFPLQLKPKPH